MLGRKGKGEEVVVFVWGRGMSGVLVCVWWGFKRDLCG